MPEAVVARLRPHGRALFWPSLALIAILGATGYFYGSFDEVWQNLAVLGGALLLGVLLWLLPLLHWLGRHYTITTRRIVLRDVPAADLVQSAIHDLMEASQNPVSARRQQEQSAAPDETTAWGVR